MLVRLDTPYADGAAADLSLTFDEPVRPALHELALPALGVRLRLLGASHQVVTETLVETVACLPDSGGPLPAAYGRGRLRFTARIRPVAAGPLRDQVAAVRRMVAADPCGLVGEFPGHPDAVTALQATASGGRLTGWRTWHAYPQTGELVTTRTALAG